jgi:hypothetical protein
MALLSFRGLDTPSLPAQGEQRLPLIFNIQRGKASKGGSTHSAARPTATKASTTTKTGGRRELNLVRFDARCRLSHPSRLSSYHPNFEIIAGD